MLVLVIKNIFIFLDFVMVYVVYSSSIMFLILIILLILIELFLDLIYVGVLFIWFFGIFLV